MSQYRPREGAGHRRGTDHRSRVDKHKAAEVAGEELSSYRALSYDELVSKIGYAESFERISETGEPYQIEVDFHFDDSKEQNIRVVAMVSYSWWTDFSPVSSDFIMAPDGSFVGE